MGIFKLTTCCSLTKQWC